MNTEEQKVRYVVNEGNFSKIPGSQVAYWVGENTLRVFERSVPLSSYATVKHGLSTGKNDFFVRRWTEVKWEDIDFSLTDRSQMTEKSRRYYPYNKGGEFRKWYGNLDFVIWYDFEGQRKMATLSGHRHDGREYYFHEGITWSFISSSYFGVRYSPSGAVFDVAGSSLFPAPESIYFLCAVLTSKIAQHYLDILNPTLNFQVGNIAVLPIIKQNEAEIESLAKKCIELSRIDWDAFETSWDFKRHPLI